MKKLLKTFLIDFVYFILTTIIIIIGRLKIEKMYLAIQGYGPQLDSLDLDKDATLAQTILSQINTSTNQISLFIFIILPLILFIIYLAFQGYSYYSFHKKKNFYYKFALSGIISLIFLVLFIFTSHYSLLILFIISSYLTFFLYFKDLKSIKLVLNKIYIYFPSFLLYIILFFLILTAFFMTDASYNVGNAFYWYLAFGIILTLFFSMYKIYLIKKFS